MKDHQFEISLSLFTFISWGTLFTALFHILIGAITAVVSAVCVYFVTHWVKRQFPDGRFSLRRLWKK